MRTLVVYFKKNLDFHKQSIFDISSWIANVLMAILLAFILKNVWALVWANLAMAITLCLIFYSIRFYRPLFEFDFDKVCKLFDFGKWIFRSSILCCIEKTGA